MNVEKKSEWKTPELIYSVADLIRSWNFKHIVNHSRVKSVHLMPGPASWEVISSPGDLHKTVRIGTICSQGGRREHSRKNLGQRVIPMVKDNPDKISLSK